MKSGFSTAQPFHPSLLRDFRAWVKKPSYRLHPGEGIGVGQKLWVVARCWAASSLVVGLVAILIGIVMNLTGTADTEHSLTELLFDGSPWIVLIFAAVIAPIQEEMAFRLWLLPRRNTLAFGFSAFVWFFIIPILAQFIDQIDQMFVSYNVLLVMSLGWVVTGVITSFILKMSRKLDIFQAFIQRRFRRLVFVSALVFGLAHLVNYPEIASIWYLGPLLILPQFVIGYPLAYVRTKLGLIWSILYHGMHNAFLLLPLLLARLTGIDGQNFTPEMVSALPEEKLVLIGSTGVLYIWITIIGIALVTQLLVESHRHREAQ